MGLDPAPRLKAFNVGGNNHIAVGAPEHTDHRGFSEEGADLDLAPFPHKHHRDIIGAAMDRGESVGQDALPGMPHFQAGASPWHPLQNRQGWQNQCSADHQGGNRMSRKSPEEFFPDACQNRRFSRAKGNTVHEQFGFGETLPGCVR